MPTPTEAVRSDLAVEAFFGHDAAAHRCAMDLHARRQGLRRRLQGFGGVRVGMEHQDQRGVVA
jgi:hypothetical protein